MRVFTSKHQKKPGNYGCISYTQTRTHAHTHTCVASVQSATRDDLRVINPCITFCYETTNLHVS